MRIERKGKVESITPRVKSFLKNALQGIDLDEVYSDTIRRPDFACLDGKFIVEIKTLESDGSERINNLNEELRKREDYPLFYGNAPISSVIKNMESPEELNQKAVDRLSRAIVDHLKKANKQLKAYSEANPNPDAVNVVFLINEDHALYEPKIVAYVVQRALNKKEGEKLAFQHIDAVIYLTERHMAEINGKPALAVMTIEGPAIEAALWKRAQIDSVSKQWIRWNGSPLIEASKTLDDYVTVEHIPDKMKRHAFWELQYRRNPYMQTWAKEQIRMVFDELVTIGCLSFVKGCPIKVSQELTAYGLERMSHVMIEMARRAIPVTEFRKESARIIAAGKRLNLDQNVMDWLAKLSVINEETTLTNP